MPNITLYVKDSDLQVVNAARADLGESLSSLFVDCLRTRIADAAPGIETDKMEKIALRFWNANDEPTILKSFTGRWLVCDLRADDDSSGPVWDAGAEYSVAQTAKGKIVVYLAHCNDRFAPTMETYEDFDEMKSAEDDNAPRYPQNMIAETAAALGRPYEIELDI